MDGFHRLPLDTLKSLFSTVDISLTVSRIEAMYVNFGKGRPRYPVRSMLLALLFMRFEAIPSVRKLCRRLERRQYAKDICKFNGHGTPNHTTFSKFITRAKPETIEGMFAELRDQAFSLGITDYTAGSMSALSITYIVRAANVNDKELADPLMKKAVERAFKAGKHELMMESLKWRGIAKIRMHVAITAHKIGRPELAKA